LTRIDELLSITEVMKNLDNKKCRIENRFAATCTPPAPPPFSEKQKGEEKNPRELKTTCSLQIPHRLHME
jgi:hypothetical protein